MERRTRLLAVLVVELILQCFLVSYLLGMWGCGEAATTYPDGKSGAHSNLAVKSNPNYRLQSCPGHALYAGAFLWRISAGANAGVGVSTL